MNIHWSKQKLEDELEQASFLTDGAQLKQYNQPKSDLGTCIRIPDFGSHGTDAHRETTLSILSR